MKKYPVYLGACDRYDADEIENVIERAMKTIVPARPIAGRVVIKPNLCFTHRKVTSGSHTHAEVTEGILRILKREKAVTKIDIVEKSGLGVTTQTMFRHAGYRPLARKYGVKLRAMEEGRQSRVVLKNGRVHHYITIAREMVERDFLIFAPKMKTNVLSQGYTGALKLNIGTIDSRERLFHHDRDLHVKIVDILEAANPDLIVMDGIRLSYGGNQMTEPDTELGVIAVSANAVAHDMVCSRLIGLDPFKIDHIREAMERGYGPNSFDQIEILGDYPLEKGQSIARKLDFGFMPVQDFKCPFKIQSGMPYCVGGCQGIFLDWLHMIRDRKPKLLKRFPRITVLIGKVERAVSDRTVLLVGNCAQASASIDARRIVRIKGCPPSHKRIVWDMMVKFGLLAPLVRPSLIWDGFGLYPLKKLKGWLVNFRFRPVPDKETIKEKE